MARRFIIPKFQINADLLCSRLKQNETRYKTICLFIIHIILFPKQNQNYFYSKLQTILIY